MSRVESHLHPSGLDVVGVARAWMRLEGRLQRRGKVLEAVGRGPFAVVTGCVEEGGTAAFCVDLEETAGR